MTSKSLQTILAPGAGEPNVPAVRKSDFELQKAKFLQVLDAALFEATKRQEGDVIKGNAFVAHSSDDAYRMRPKTDQYSIDISGSPTSKENTFKRDLGAKLEEVLKEWGVPGITVKTKGSMGRTPDGEMVHFHETHFGHETLAAMDKVYTSQAVRQSINERAIAYTTESYYDSSSRIHELTHDIHDLAADLVPLDIDTGKPLDPAHARKVLDTIKRVTKDIGKQWGLAPIGQGVG